MTSFSIDSKSLLDALSAINALVPKKPSRDILKCIKIKGEQGKGGDGKVGPDSIRIYATDLETFAEFKLSEQIVVHSPGEFVVSSQIFLDYIKNLEDSNVEISVEDESLKIKETSAELVVGLQDVQEFPEFPTIPNTIVDWVDLPLGLIQNALPQVLFSVAERGHPRWGALSSVCLSLTKTNLNLIGTDQHRASIVDVAITEQKVEGKYLVSGTALELLGKLFTDDFKMAPNPPNSVIFRSDNCVVFARLVNGNFPPVANIIPKHPNNVQFSVSDLSKQVKKAALAADVHKTLKMEIKDQKFCLSSKTREDRKGVKIEKELTYKGAGILFSINCSYLLDLLKASNSNEDLVLHFNQNNQPILFTQTNFKHMLVPQETR